MVQVVLEDLLRKEVNQSLDIFRHLLLGLAWLKRAEVNVAKSKFKELDVEGITEKDRHVHYGLLNTQVAKHFIAKLDNGHYD